jgi:hypothetical protein
MPVNESTTDAISPLEDAGILLHVLNILGPGHHLFISAVSKAWREIYERVDSVQKIGSARKYWTDAVRVTVTPKMTLCSAIFASASRVKLAHFSGLILNEREQGIAGKIANLSTLQAAYEVGLQLTDKVLFGAAEAASIPKLQWLHTEQGCPLPEGISSYAAGSGSIEMLRWLKDRGSAFTASTCVRAAAGAHLCVLQYLRDEGCEWDESVCAAAASHGHLTTLQWLHEQGCPWYADHICGAAAGSGSVEMLCYLKQQGCVFNESTMADAAWAGQLTLCQFLLAEQCPCDYEACASAARKGHLETVRFLHETGCPWDHTTICRKAAVSGNIELLRYLQQQGCVFSEAVMRVAAEEGHTHLCQFLRAEQCPWGSSVCEAAAFEGHVDTLRWLHEQGCPFDLQAVRLTAVGYGHLPVMKYMLSVEPAASAAQLTAMLNAAGAYSDWSLAKLLREAGAEWPAKLKRGGRCWKDDVLQWARNEGCTSPL